MGDPRVDTVLLIHGVDTTKVQTHGVDTTVLQTHGVDTTVEKEEKVPRVEKEEKVPRDLTHGVDTTKTTMMITTRGVDTTEEKEEKVPRVEKEVKDPREVTVLKTHGVDTTVLIQKKTVTKSVMNTADPRAVKVEREEKGTTDLMMITPCTMITITSTAIIN